MSPSKPKPELFPRALRCDTIPPSLPIDIHKAAIICLTLLEPRNVMHGKQSFLRVLIFLAAAAAASAAQSAAPGAPTSQAPAPPATPSPSQVPSKPSAQAPQTMRVRTRLVTIDVVATNSHGAVRDLKAEDFQVSDGGPQKIEKFAFIDRSAHPAANSVAAPAKPAPDGSLRNQVTLTNLVMPPTVVLIDALNTEGPDLIS